MRNANGPCHRNGACLMLLALCSAPAPASAIYSVFLVRHAEKLGVEAGGKDPGLTDCGRRRAGHLARQLAEVPVRRVYSTGYRRTLATAAPVAERGVPLERYDPQRLPELAKRLLQEAEDALVVGHSNTTEVLAGLLAGFTGEAYDERYYDRLYQVIISGDQRRLIQLQQGFDCSGDDSGYRSTR